MTGVMTHDGILIKQGDSYDIAMHFKSKCGGDLDITGASVTLNVKQGEDSVLSIAGEIVEPLKGLAVIKITPQHTSIDVGVYEANIKVVFANGDVHTIFPQDITKNAIFEIAEGV
ncbi:MAG: hypothetical protein J6Y53_00565 [Alphaproteobacteria bacterium]|nr:hypothetical protein [Alphaproteobacteria bacterium]